MLSKSFIFQPWEILAFIFSYNPTADTQGWQKNIKVLEEIHFPYYRSQVFHICNMGESEPKQGPGVRIEVFHSCCNSVWK